MTSFSHRTLLILLTALPLALYGCAAKTDSATVTSSKPKPPLPADVESLSQAVEPTTATSSVSTVGREEKAAGGLATESGDTILATGELVSPVRSELATKVPGRVGRVFVDEGQRVTRGAPLLELETDYLRIAVQRAAAEVARSRAAATDAARDLERKKDLLARDSIPRAVYDRSEAARDQAAATLASAQAAAALARQQLSDAVLRAPFTGAVAERRTDVGERLSDNTVAFVLVSTSPLKLRFRVPERYLSTVHTGQAVSATVDPYPGEQFDGRVTVVGQVIDPATRTLAIESEFPNTDGRLKPGLFARVQMKIR